MTSVVMIWARALPEPGDLDIASRRTKTCFIHTWFHFYDRFSFLFYWPLHYFRIGFFTNMILNDRLVFYVIIRLKLFHFFYPFPSLSLSFSCKFNRPQRFLNFVISNEYFLKKTPVKIYVKFCSLKDWIPLWKNFFPLFIISFATFFIH